MSSSAVVYKNKLSNISHIFFFVNWQKSISITLIVKFSTYQQRYIYFSDNLTKYCYFLHPVVLEGMGAIDITVK
jgi:hypothetical protein